MLKLIRPGKEEGFTTRPPLDHTRFPAWLHWMTDTRGGGPAERQANRTNGAIAFPEPGQALQIEFTSEEVQQAEQDLRDAAKKVADLEGQWVENDLELQGMRDPERRGHLQRRNEILRELDIPEAEALRTKAAGALRQAKVAEARQHVVDLNAEIEQAEQSAFLALTIAIGRASEFHEKFNHAQQWSSYADGGPTVQRRPLYELADVFADVWREPTRHNVVRFLKSAGMRFGLEVQNGKSNR